MGGEHAFNARARQIQELGVSSKTVRVRSEHVGTAPIVFMDTAKAFVPVHGDGGDNLVYAVRDVLDDDVVADLIVVALYYVLDEVIGKPSSTRFIMKRLVHQGHIGIGVQTVPDVACG